MINNFILIDDFIELWIKINQRGLKFIFSKFNLISKARTISSFSETFEHANWWIIPFLKRCQNKLITGDYDIEYETYITKKYFSEIKSATLISIGCGEGNHELKIAALNPTFKIIGYDLSKSWIEIANKKAIAQNSSNASFYVEDVCDLKLKNESVDYFLFNSSLHHFRDIQKFITLKILPALKQNGLIIINEYIGPNRMNFPKSQMDYCTKCLLNILSKENRKILNLKLYKNHCYRVGTLRMIISDPTECVDSESIVPVLRSNLEEIEYINLGGNILVPCLKHIAHHFVNNNHEELLQLISKEKEYLADKSSNYAFAIYRKK